MQKWIMEYIKQSLLFKLGFLNTIWITYSYLEEFFHKPFQEYTMWNYFVLVEYGKSHIDKIDATIQKMVIGGIFIMTFLLFILICATLDSRRILWIDIFLFLFMTIFVIECILLVSTQNKICTYICIGIELLYFVGVGSEINIEI